MIDLDSRLASLAESRTRRSWWLASRLAVALIAAGMMLHSNWQHLFDDLNVYARWGVQLAGGQVPSADPMWQYPPLAAFIFGFIGWLGSQPWMFALFFALVDLAITVVLARDARQRGRWDGFAVWIAAPLLVGPIMYGRYDSVPTLFALLGFLALARPLVAGSWLGIGGGLKVWPALLAFALRRKDWMTGALGAGLALAGSVVAAALAFPGIVGAFLGNGEARGLQTESVAALPFVWARLFNVDVPEAFRYGSSEVGVPLADAIAPLLLPLTALGLLVLIGARLVGKLDRVPVADIAFVAILWLLVTSRVLSPQFNVWLVGMAALVWAAGSPRMRRATWWAFATALLAQILYPVAYVDIVDGGLIGIVLQTLRIAALLMALGTAVSALRLEAKAAAIDLRDVVSVPAGAVEASP
ncbi:MAG: glycosyltransferase 87 family protein [Candidatus Nanopelagicales bacterium]